MMSLKAFAPILASLLQTTPAAIYERQRALVRSGVLPTPIGRGRGNGLPATAETAALMLMAIMVTDNLSDTDGRVQKLAEARVDMRARKQGCRLTKAPTFKAALTAILASEELSAAVSAIYVSRTDLHGTIHFYWGRNRTSGRTRFGQEAPFPNDLETTARLRGAVVQAISKALKATEPAIGNWQQSVTA
jgi:cell division protein ZapA (FtsZ GTPase activity inhibitor)